eukprot:SAG22_NODE_209_length_15177_cov_9.282995_9_plen_410_part_00
MASDPPESVPPQQGASGAEIAPLVGAGAAEPDHEEPAARAAREVTEAEQLRAEWEAGRHDAAPFALTVQPSIGGEGAAVVLEGVTSQMSAAELHDRIYAEMPSKPTPDEQRLFIVKGAKGPLRDETLPIGAYGVVPGVTLHLAMRDGKAAAARRAARAQVRAEQAAARAQVRAEQAAAPQVRAERAAARAERAAVLARCKAQAKAAAKVLGIGVTIALVVLLIIWLAAGCVGDPCGEFGVSCSGLIAQCTCSADHNDYVGEFCGRWSLGTMIMRSGYNNATVQAVEYMGPSETLTWELQHSLCAAAGRATPGSSSLGNGIGNSVSCAYSPTDNWRDVVDNYVVTDRCTWQHQAFTHVSGSLGGGMGFMCAYSYYANDCHNQVRVEGTTARGKRKRTATLTSGDSVFCSA